MTGRTELRGGSRRGSFQFPATHAGGETSTPEGLGNLKGMMDGISKQFGGARRGGSRRHRSSLSRRRSYRRRVKSSPCRKKGPAVCRSMKNCKFVSKKRRYCRKGKNTRRRTSGGARRGGARRGGARRGGSRRGGSRRGGSRR